MYLPELVLNEKVEQSLPSLFDRILDKIKLSDPFRVGLVHPSVFLNWSLL